MQKKIIEIPFQQLINDSKSIYSERYAQDLARMRQEVAISEDHVSEEPQQTMKSIIVSRKKRSKKEMNTKKFDHSFLNISKLGLRKVLQQQKVKSITRNFINKIKRNISVSQPTQYHPYIPNFSQDIFNNPGIQIPNWFDLSFAFFSIIQILALFFVYTLALVFDQFIDPDFISTLQTFSMCFYTIEIIINFISIKTIDGRKIIPLKEIFINYIKRKFFIDLLCLVILIVDINSRFIVTNYVRLCVVLKIKQCLEKMEKIENVFCNNFYKEQYWSLAKVFLVNFGFAHVLAVALLAMASLSDTSNWIIKIKAQAAPWYELYSWAYYWGTTIMLTVGFGDLSASNYKEAICLTIIQTFSCILLAYNINCVGNLITNIRTQGQEKTKNFRIMRKLAESNQIAKQLQWKVCNFIDESDKMKKEFGFDEEKQFISKLPPQLKAQFLKESNIKIFLNISFFKAFTEKTLLNLAQSIQVKIAHPEQIIFKTELKPQILILKQGKIGYCTRLPGSDFNGTVIDKIKIENKNDPPRLLYLGFLCQNTRNIKFKVKSLHYSTIYYLDVSQMLEILQNCSSDFQNYCQMKDKSKHIIDEFQLIDCPFCPTRHSKMNCPRLHYMPLYQMVVYKNMENVRIAKNGRMGYTRGRNRAHLGANNPFKLQNYFQKLAQSIYKNKNRSSKKKQPSKKQQSYLAKLETQNSNPNSNPNNSFYLQKISVLLSRKQEQQHSSTFEWDIVCDRAHNFKFYFPDCNSCGLGNVSLSSKQKKDGDFARVFPELSKVLGSTGFLKVGSQKN